MGKMIKKSEFEEVYYNFCSQYEEDYFSCNGISYDEFEKLDKEKQDEIYDDIEFGIEDCIHESKCKVIEKIYGYYSQHKDEEIDLLDILDDLNHENDECNFSCSNFNELAAIYLNELFRDEEPFLLMSNKTLMEYRKYTLTSIINNNINDIDYFYYHCNYNNSLDFNEFSSSYEKNMGEYSWMLLKPIFDKLGDLKFKDIYPDYEDKVNSLFDCLDSLKNAIDVLKDEMNNCTGYGGRLLTLGQFKVEDLEKLHIEDEITIENEQIKVIHNEKIWNYVFEEMRLLGGAREQEVEEDLGR